MFCVRYVCGDGRLLGLGVRDARAECLEERLPRLDDTDALRGVSGAIMSAGQVLSQCCIDHARLSDTGCCVFLSASSVCANNCEDAYDSCDVEFNDFDGFEGGGDVRRVSGLTCRVLDASKCGRDIVIAARRRHWRLSASCLKMLYEGCRLIQLCKRAVEGDSSWCYECLDDHSNQ
jgi:hypothetical protein